MLIAALMMVTPLVVRGGSQSEGQSRSATSSWEQRKCNFVALWRLILLAIAYGLGLNSLQTLAGSTTAIRTIGLALGLFICA